MTLRRIANALVSIGIVVTVTMTASCSKADSDAAVILDGRPRYPDAEGVVTKVSRKSITVGSQTFAVSPDLQSFSSATLQTVPLLQRRDQYVQIGLEGETVVWIASISAVVRLAEPAAFHIGKVKSVDAGERRLLFADGTVLRLADDVDLPPAGRQTTAEIDPERAVVRRLEIAPS